MGHFIAARIAGLCIFEFGIWPVRLVRSSNKFRLMRFDMPFPQLGKVVALPTNSRLLSCKRLLLISAGPMTNVLIAITSFAVFYALPLGKPSISTVAALLLIVTSINMFLFVANLRPRGTKKFYPDG